MRTKLFFLSFILLAISVHSQVAINADNVGPDASAMLDISSTSSGILIPRMTTGDRDNISSPATGLTVYVTDDNTFYYFDGNDWVPLQKSGKAWLLEGNDGTDGSQFIGTTDEQPLIIKTNNAERIRIKDNGVIGINVAPDDNYLLYAESDEHISIGRFVNNKPNFDGYGVYANSSSTDFYGYGGYFIGGWMGIRSMVTPTGSNYYYGIYSTVMGGDGYNYGIKSFASGDGHLYGVYGEASSTENNWIYGIYGTSSGSNAFNIGCRGNVSDATGTGVMASNFDDSGTGLIAIGNNLSTFSYPTNGGGLAANGSKIGVFGYGTDSGDNVWGGYFTASNNTDEYAYVGGNLNGTSYKINGPGSVSTVVNRPDGTRANMFAPEAPEILFQDYGTGKLNNGRAHIDLDPVLANNIIVNDKHPLRVFIQLEGECEGVYVANKTQNGFDVIELHQGSSNVGFSWTIIANRADTYDENAHIISKNADVRFPDGPAPIPTQTTQKEEPVNFQSYKKESN